MKENYYNYQVKLDELTDDQKEIMDKYESNKVTIAYSPEELKTLNSFDAIFPNEDVYPLTRKQIYIETGQKIAEFNNEEQFYADEKAKGGSMAKGGEISIKTWNDKNGWNIEVYKNDKLIDWRKGLTKSGFDKYKKNYDEKGYLSEGTKDEYASGGSMAKGGKIKSAKSDKIKADIEFLKEMIASPDVPDDEKEIFKETIQIKESELTEIEQQEKKEVEIETKEAEIETREKKLKEDDVLGECKKLLAEADYNVTKKGKKKIISREVRSDTEKTKEDIKKVENRVIKHISEETKKNKEILKNIETDIKDIFDDIIEISKKLMKVAKKGDAKTIHSVKRVTNTLLGKELKKYEEGGNL